MSEPTTTEAVEGVAEIALGMALGTAAVVGSVAGIHWLQGGGNHILSPVSGLTDTDRLDWLEGKDTVIESYSDWPKTMLLSSGFVGRITAETVREAIDEAMAGSHK